MNIVSIAERPDLQRAVNALMPLVWPELLRHDKVGDAFWDDMFTLFPQFQLCALDDDDTLIAAFNAVAIDWDGGAGWRDEGWRGAFRAGCTTPPDTHQSLCALAMSILPSHQGQGLSPQLLEAARATARAAGFARLVAPVRPNVKPQYPLTSIADYVAWRRADGTPFDPWLRVHERLGAKVLGIAPRSMRVEGTIADWENWTDLRFPQSGDYVIPHAFQPIHMDLTADRAIYVEPNVWMEHSL